MSNNLKWKSRLKRDFKDTDIAGQTTPQLTKGEKENGLERRWVPFKEALSIFSTNEKYRNIYEEKRGAYLREYTALMKIIENKDISLS